MDWRGGGFHPLKVKQSQHFLNIFVSLQKFQETPLVALNSNHEPIGRNLSEHFPSHSWPRSIH